MLLYLKVLEKVLEFQVLFKSIWVQVQVLLQISKSIWVQVQVLSKVFTSTSTQVQIQVPTQLCIRLV